MSENFKIVSSQYKHLLHYDESVIDPRTINSASALKNEPFSFQALYRMDGGLKSHRVSVWVETDLPVKAYRVDYVPV